MSLYENMGPENRERLDTAALWWNRLQKDPAIELSGGFLEWISDPLNCRAFKAIESTMASLEDFGATPTILDMRRSALKRLRNAGVSRWFPKKRAIVAMAAALLIAVGGISFYAWNVNQPLSYQTDVGERRVIALPDGSRISLDSNSRVDVRYSKAARAIELERGRARFDVAHDVARPFTVAAGSKMVIAVGTSFDVERRGTAVVITLIQGHVLVRENGPIPTANLPKIAKPVSLLAGQQLVAVENRLPQVKAADLETATAWEVGHLVFRGVPLADAIEQVNRYTDQPIIVDPSAASIRISGVFNAGDIGSFVSAVTGYFPIEATTDNSSRITLQKRS